MDPLVPVHSAPGCEIREGPLFLRCAVGPGQPHEVQECYRTLAAECLLRGKSLLVVGAGGSDSFVHLAGRDSLRAIAVAGAPAGFRIALVAATSDMIAIYDAAVVEASRLGLQARRCKSEADAETWLASGTGIAR